MGLDVSEQLSIPVGIGDGDSKRTLQTAVLCKEVAAIDEGLHAVKRRERLPSRRSYIQNLRDGGGFLICKRSAVLSEPQVDANYSKKLGPSELRNHWRSGSWRDDESKR